MSVYKHSFSGTGTSPSFTVFGRFNVSVQFSASGNTVILQRSFDDGSTWEDVDSYTESISEVKLEPERRVLYRLNCSIYSSGSIDCRIGAPGRL